MALQMRQHTAGVRASSKNQRITPFKAVVVTSSPRANLRVHRGPAPPMSVPEPAPAGLEDDEEFQSDSARKKAEADRLRAAEKFMVIGSGEAECKGCGYKYSPDKGDPDFPVPKGVRFQELPEDYTCPICGAEKTRFESRVKVVAGFAENQQFGLGTNSMTESQKSLLIYGALAVFFLMFLAGYALD